MASRLVKGTHIFAQANSQLVTAQPGELAPSEGDCFSRCRLQRARPLFLARVRYSSSLTVARAAEHF